MGLVQDLKGLKYGRLTVIEFLGIDKHRKAIWKCICDCGKSKTVVSGNLRKKGGTKSCGCLQLEAATKHGHSWRTHGHAGDKYRNASLTYKSWCKMKTRCFNTKHINYDNYGGRGITVCDRWLTFDNFLADMGERISLEYTIDRINANGNYEPGNCLWATRSEQERNKRKSPRDRSPGGLEN